MECCKNTFGKLIKCDETLPHYPELAQLTLYTGHAGDGRHLQWTLSGSNGIWNSCQHKKIRANSRFASSQWTTALLCNNVFHWLGVSLESRKWMLFHALTSTRCNTYRSHKRSKFISKHKLLFIRDQLYKFVISNSKLPKSRSSMIPV